jgi:hypothetical protein
LALKTLNYFLLTFLLLPSILALISPTALGQTAQSEAFSSITSAKNQVIDCYNLALMAEKKGANITSLQVSLNNAGDLISKADSAYSNVDYPSTIVYADQSTNLLNGFAAKTTLLIETGQQSQNYNLIVSTFSAVWSIVIIIVSLLAWMFIKKKYQVNQNRPFQS